MKVRYSILAAAVLFSSFGMAQETIEKVSCIDDSLGTVIFSLETKGGLTSVFTYDIEEKKTLVDQGLKCRFSTDDKKLFLCSKNNPEGVLIQYFSQVEITESLFNPSVFTVLYKKTWGGDVGPSPKVISTLVGHARNQCQ